MRPTGRMALLPHIRADHYAAIFWTGDRDYELPATIELQSIVGLSQRNDPWTDYHLFDDETNALAKLM